MRTGSAVGLALLVLCAGGPATAAEGLYDASYGNEGRLIHSDFGAISATVRPESTADGAIGNDRNRSMTPVPASAAMPTVGPITANARFCTSTPGTRNSR